MTRSFALIVALSASPAFAQEVEEPGFLERGLGAIIGQLFDPETEGLSDALRQMGPVLRDLAAQVDDIGNYHAPERLPNGDILIRRRDEAPAPPPLGESLRPDEPALPQIAL